MITLITLITFKLSSHIGSEELLKEIRTALGTQ